jgi:hypothetical protein
MMVMGADPHRGQRGIRTFLVICVVEVGGSGRQQRLPRPCSRTYAPTWATPAATAVMVVTVAAAAKAAAPATAGGPCSPTVGVAGAGRCCGQAPQVGSGSPWRLPSRRVVNRWRRGCAYGFLGPLDGVLLAAVLDPARAAARAEGAPVVADDDGDLRGRAQRAAWHPTPPGWLMGGSVLTSGRCPSGVGTRLGGRRSCVGGRGAC